MRSREHVDLRRIAGWRAGFVVFFALSTTLRSTAMASAAGAASLQKFIIPDPLRGGKPLSQPTLNDLVEGIQKVEDATSGESNAKTTIAALGWREADSPKKTVVILLVALSIPDQSGNSVNQQAAIAAVSEAATVCVGATGSPPTVDVGAGIPNSHYVRSPAGFLDAVTTARGDTFAMILSTTATMPTSHLESLGLEQYRALSASASSLTT